MINTWKKVWVWGMLSYVCLVCSLLVLLQLLFSLLRVCLKDTQCPCLFDVCLEIHFNFFFSGFSFWPWGNFPVPNVNKKKYPEFAWGGIHAGTRIRRRKRKEEVSGIRVGQPCLLLSSSGVMLFNIHSKQVLLLEDRNMTNIRICT